MIYKYGFYIFFNLSILCVAICCFMVENIAILDIKNFERPLRAVFKTNEGFYYTLAGMFYFCATMCWILQDHPNPLERHPLFRDKIQR